MTKHKNKFKRGPSREDQLSNYQASLLRRRVSDTVRLPYDDNTSGTADYRPPGGTYYSALVPANGPPTFISKYFKEILSVIGLLITLIVIVSGVVYKFGTLEKSVEYIQKTVAELNIRMNKIEDKVNNSVKRE
jgi:hypothetical protein